MMRRRGAPTLYELTKSGGRGSISGGSGGLFGGNTPSVSLLGNEAARSIRVPVGFLWLLAIAVLVLAAGSYMIGFVLGHAAGIPEGYSAKLSDDNARALARSVNDPMKQDAAAVSVTPQKALPSTGATSPGNSVTVAKSNTQKNSSPNYKGDSKPGSEPASNEDPREKGVNYLTLARPSAEQAENMLAFCKAEGLAAHLVLDNNAKLRKIIVTPGLRTTAVLQTKDGQELLAKVKSVGVRWKAQKKGNKDFSDAYLELFR
ncbi:MAG: hypothetical protein EXS12_03485 [Phycisphaerales bacterium]|nr:hypothetical protein [Phycisphaerales bacterium]